jgi:hypothetical protein
MADEHLLDRPVWATLCGAHAPFSVGCAMARRFRADVNVFASACDESDAAAAALAALLAPGDTVGVLQVPPIAVPPGLAAVRHGGRADGRHA